MKWIGGRRGLLTVAGAVLLILIVIGISCIGVEAESYCPPEASSMNQNTVAQEYTGHAGHDNIEGQWTVGMFVFAALRILFETSLYATVGSILWGAVAFRDRAELHAETRRLSLYCFRCYWIFFIIDMYVESDQAVNGNTLTDLIHWFVEPGRGLSLLALFVLGLIGYFFIIRRSSHLQLLWSLFMILAQYDGRLLEPSVFFFAKWIAYSAFGLTVAWLTAGLLLTYRFRLQKRWDEMWKFVLRLTDSYRVACLISILSITMVLWLEAELLLENIDGWHVAVLICTGMVWIVGKVMRGRISQMKEGKWSGLSLSMILIFCIICITSNQSMASDLSANKPFYWHQMGNEMHVTIQITPNRAGLNQFIAKVWLPQQEGPPKRVSMELETVRDSVKSRLEIPLSLAVQGDPELEEYTFDGFTSYLFQGEGRIPKSKGLWRVKLEVLDAGQVRHVSGKEFEVNR